jgi:hypothetical protein
MGPKSITSILRALALLLLVSSVLLLSLSSAAWATPAQRPLEQSDSTVQPGRGDGDDDRDDDFQGGTAYPPPGLQPGPGPGEPPRPKPDVPIIPGDDDGVRVDIPPGEGGAIDLFPWEVIITPDDFVFPIVVEAGPGCPDPPNPGEVHTGTTLNVIIVDENGNQVAPIDFLGPIEIVYNLSPEELALIEGDLRRAIIQVYDEELGIWIDLPTIINPDGSVSVFVNYTGCFALRLAGPEEFPAVLPVTSIEIPLPAALPDTAGELPGARVLYSKPLQSSGSCAVQLAHN